MKLAHHEEDLPMSRVAFTVSALALWGAAVATNGVLHDEETLALLHEPG